MFARYVSYEAICKAGFNYWEPSFPIDRDGERFIVYHTKFPLQPKPNLVVIESFDNPEELYFRVFLGKSSGECETEAEAQLFFEEVRKSISPEFRVAGIDLEKKILELLDKIDNGRFSSLRQ